LGLGKNTMVGGRRGSKRPSWQAPGGTKKFRKAPAYSPSRPVFRPRAVSSYYPGSAMERAVEVKFHDVDVDDASVAQAGTILIDSLVKIAQGTGESQRDGRKILVTAIGWKFNLSMQFSENTGQPADDVVRIMLYLDKQANGATAAVTDLLETDNYQSFNNLANRGRFKTLMDRTYTLNRTAGGGDVGAANTNWAGFEIDDSFYKKCAIPVEFSAAAGAITEIRSNNIGVLIISKTGAVGVLDSKARIRFTG